MYKEENVWKFRTWLYVIVIISILSILAYKCFFGPTKETNPKVISWENLANAEDPTNQDDFWPCDMIPHPHPPKEYTEDPTKNMA